MKYTHEDGTPFSKKEFLEKLKTDKEFNDKFGNKGIDQITELIRTLKDNPDSRRLLVSAWNASDLRDQVLPPCHYGFQVYTRELSLEERENLMDKIYGLTKETRIVPWNILDINKANIPTRAISLMWNQRSCDLFLGIPFNIASYGLLLEIIAKEVNMVPDELIGNLGDVHLYSNHIEQAKEQIGRELTHRERIEELIETNKDAKSLLSQEEPEAISSLLLDELKVSKRTREPFPLPTLNINTEFWQTESGECGVRPLKTNLQGFEISDFVIENYQSHPTIKAPLSN
jgi:thymidylate synthase